VWDGENMSAPSLYLQSAIDQIKEQDSDKIKPNS